MIPFAQNDLEPRISMTFKIGVEKGFTGDNEELQTKRCDTIRHGFKLVVSPHFIQDIDYFREIYGTGLCYGCKISWILEVNNK